MVFHGTMVVVVVVHLYAWVNRDTSIDCVLLDDRNVFATPQWNRDCRSLEMSARKIYRFDRRTVFVIFDGT